MPLLVAVLMERNPPERAKQGKQHGIGRNVMIEVDGGMNHQADDAHHGGERHASERLVAPLPLGLYGNPQAAECHKGKE